MNRNKRILTVIPMTEEQRTRLEAAMPDSSFVYAEAEKVTQEQVRDADIILGNVPVSMLSQAEHLEWLHLNTAGFEQYSVPGVLRAGTLLTNSTGAYGKAVSEHLFVMALAIQKRLPAYRDNQRNHIWRDEGEVVSMSDARVLVLGTGDIGSHFASLAHAFGAYVIGVKRTPGTCPEGVDELHLMDDLDSLLPQADVVAAFLPSTAQTKGLFDREKLSLMKKGSIFVNGGRGDLVCTEDLCDVLESGHLLGAALDVTDPEPLPADHRLWEIPNAFVTPHISGYYHLPETLKNIVEICIENVRRYACGEEMRNNVK
ncbi:MAG: D-2-hydroxyacid dehydrogenase [Lachnospiraceae bacterium]|nr:D-2-hydroxyacid dehydrogenase [Lachnospiraceae bacterium]MCD7841868.1 D-2-hydroxyacid dehydrogenase [Lachnospiraceae bacterium]